ncbi:MAG: hypothetical protein ACOX3A_10475 [bacterium]
MRPLTHGQTTRILGYLLIMGGIGLCALVLPPWIWAILVGSGLIALGWSIIRLDRF